MFLFLYFDSETGLTNQEKGKLFEGLVKELVQAMGYKDINLREKKAGKEYDITANQKLTNTKLIGQAKAIKKSITSATLAEFIGSMDIEDFPDDATGLFISISGFTPDAERFLDRIKKKKRERVKTIVGQEIFEKLNEIGYLGLDAVKNLAETAFGMKPGDTYLLVTEKGNYFIQLLARKDEFRPKAFCIIDKTGILISEKELGDKITQRLDDFKDLKFLYDQPDFTSTFDRLPGPIGPGPEGASWFEYKLPAPPPFFIGREKEIKTVNGFLNNIISSKTGIRVYQILSPSGVGKTSFLLKIQNELKQIKVISFHDARDFRSRVDLLAVLQDFLENSRVEIGIPIVTPSQTHEVIQEIKAVNDRLEKTNSLGTIIIDQFESIFSKPELFDDFIEIVNRIVHYTSRIVFCIARRNDQPITFDDSVSLDLSRLISISQSIDLKDFSRKEAIELLSHLEGELNQKIRKNLILLALEFAASGFPWLTKRVGAHIRDSIKRGTTQEELIQYGINPVEFFEEDISELDIIHREFLKSIAHYLPATVEDLSHKYDGNVLSINLKLFQDLRLVRLIGRTYDTYNDVFKEYLKTGEIPLTAKYAFRSAPSSVMNIMNLILEEDVKTINELYTTSDFQIGTLQNILRELRLLGLVSTSRGSLVTDNEAIEANKDGNIIPIIRERLLHRNGLVREVLTRISTKADEKIYIKEIEVFLREGLPVLELSSSTWQIYARAFSSWLRYFGLVRPGQIVNEKGKPVGATRLATRDRSFFIPTIYIRQLNSSINKFLGKDKIRYRDLTNKQYFELSILELIKPDSNKRYWIITKKGKTFRDNPNIRPKVIREILIKQQYIMDYLSLIEESPKKHIEVLKAVLKDMAFTEGTWEWRSKLVANWLEFSGLAIRSRGSIVRSKQSNLFNQ